MVIAPRLRMQTASQSREQERAAADCGLRCLSVCYTAATTAGGMIGMFLASPREAGSLSASEIC